MMQNENTPYAQFDNVHAQPQQYYPQQQQPQQYTQPQQYGATPVYDQGVQPQQPSQYYSGAYVQPHYDEEYHKKKNDDMALLLFIVGLFIPIVWVILFFITRDKTKYSNKARTIGNVGCGMIIASVICYAIIMVIIIAANVAIRAK